MARPSASASSDFTVRGKYRSSIAFAFPTSRWRVKLEPVSHESATLAKARLKPAVSATIRRSQANARLAPAPAATPLTAAITGFAIPTSVVTIGL